MHEFIIQISLLFWGYLSIVSTCIPCMLHLDCQLLPCFLWVRPQWCINEKQHVCRKEKHADELLMSVLQSAGKLLLHDLSEHSMGKLFLLLLELRHFLARKPEQSSAVPGRPRPRPSVCWRCNGGYREILPSNAYMQRSLWRGCDASRRGGCWSPWRLFL